MLQMLDQQYMEQAILLGENARLIAPPNPWVGCLIVKNDLIIGMGHTQAVGLNHAEIMALNSAMGPTEGATVYVTLEPCAHSGKTPPCVDALINAKVARVVIAVKDPDPRVAGRGIERLQQSGIEVTTGVCEESATESLASYLHQRKTGLPFCIVKVAISIDGKIAAADGTSQWISSSESRVDAHRLRAESQAILIGSGTALKDNPRLTVRDTNILPAMQPLRVILDTKGQLQVNLNIFNCKEAPTLIVTSSECSLEKRQEWEKCGAEVAVISLNEKHEGLDLKSLFSLLGKRGILQVLAEGGSVLHGNLIKDGLCNRLIVYVGGCLLGNNGLGTFAGINVETISQAPKFELLHVTKFGSCAKLEYVEKVE